MEEESEILTEENKEQKVELCSEESNESSCGEGRELEEVLYHYGQKNGKQVKGYHGHKEELQFVFRRKNKKELYGMCYLPLQQDQDDELDLSLQNVKDYRNFITAYFERLNLDGKAIKIPYEIKDMRFRGKNQFLVSWYGDDTDEGTTWETEESLEKMSQLSKEYEIFMGWLEPGDEVYSEKPFPNVMKKFEKKRLQAFKKNKKGILQKNKWKYLLYFQDTKYKENIRREVIDMLYPGKLSIENWDGRDISYAKQLILNHPEDERKQKDGGLIYQLLEKHRKNCPYGARNMFCSKISCVKECYFLTKYNKIWTSHLKLETDCEIGRELNILSKENKN